MSKIKNILRKCIRYNLKRKNRKNLKNFNFTIISNNCLGGVISNELGQRFNSPTINLFFDSTDFLKFIKNMEHYLDYEWKDISSDKDTYPKAKIDDITLNLVHYNSFEEAKLKWNERKVRINYDNIFVIACQRDGWTRQQIEEFDKLHYKNKVIFTTKEMQNFDSAYHIQNTDCENENMIINIMTYKDDFSGKRWFDDFDFVSFFNNGLSK